MTQPILFHIPMTGKVDRENHIIRGVSLITGDLEAEGHGLHVDDTTINQILKFAKESGQITVKADHKGADGKTFTSIVGYVKNFSKEGKKVRGDLHLLETESLTPKIQEMAEVMPQNFGLSVAFKGPQKGEKIGSKNFARCEKLLSVDLVEKPAANPDGMFSVVDTTSNVTMPTQNNSQQGAAQSGPVTLETLAAMITQQNEAIANLTSQVAAQEQFLQNSNNGDQNGPSIDELIQIANATDEELIAAGIDINEARSAVEQAVANGQLTTGDAGDAGADAGQQQADGGALMGDAQVAGSVGAALSALQKQVHALSAARTRDIQLAAKGEEEHALSVIESKIADVISFATQVSEEIKTVKAENDALRVAIKTGHSFAGAATDDGVNLFSSANAPDGTYQKLVTVKFNELVQKGTPELKARKEAVVFCVKNHPVAYQEYRAKGGGDINLQAK